MRYRRLLSATMASSFFLFFFFFSSSSSASSSFILFLCFFFSFLLLLPFFFFFSLFFLSLSFLTKHELCWGSAKAVHTVSPRSSENTSRRPSKNRFYDRVPLPDSDVREERFGYLVKSRKTTGVFFLPSSFLPPLSVLCFLHPGWSTYHGRGEVSLC